MTPQPDLPLIYIAGWGMPARPGFADDFGRDLRCYMVTEASTKQLPKRFIGIGHSLGVMWLLKTQSQALAGLISLSGSACFRQREDFPTGMPTRILTRMQKRFQDAPATVWTEFRARAGYPVTSSEPQPDWPVLGQGLQDLHDWDCLAQAVALKGPLAALHTTKDPIIPLAACQASFPDQVHVLAGECHALPYTHPQDCAAFIRKVLGC